MQNSQKEREREYGKLMLPSSNSSVLLHVNPHKTLENVHTKNQQNSVQLRTLAKFFVYPNM